MPEQTPSEEQVEGADVSQQPEPEETTEPTPQRAMPRRSAGSIVAAFFKPSRGQLVAGLVLFATALLVTWTLRSQAAQPEFATARQADLVQLLDNVTGQTKRLEADLRELETLRNELESGVDRDIAARDDAERRLEQLQIIAGLVPATGPGVRITIEDPEGKVTSELMLNAIEELRDAGAEVIELNDTVRVVMRTAFTVDEKGHLVAGGQTIAPPYIIDAIGDPGTLEAGARFRGGLVSEVEGGRVGGAVTITQMDVVKIDATVAPTDNEFARPR